MALFYSSSKIYGNCGCPKTDNIDKDKSYLSRQIAKYEEYVEEKTKGEEFDKFKCYKVWNKSENQEIYKALEQIDKDKLNEIIDKMNNNQGINEEINAINNENLKKLIEKIQHSHCQIENGTKCSKTNFDRQSAETIRNPNPDMAGKIIVNLLFIIISLMGFGYLCKNFKEYAYPDNNFNVGGYNRRINKRKYMGKK